jgi:cytochrome P450
VNKLINTIIADRKQTRAAAAAAAELQGDKTAKDLLDIILNASESDLSPQYLRDEIITFMGAGHETTATTTMWTLYELCRHPSILVKLQQEIDGILGNPTSTDRIEVIIYENINKFEYLTAVVKESLRLHPPVSMIGRKNLEDYQLGDFVIRKNSLIGINMLAVHTNPVYWKDPWEYKPERWLDGTKIHPFQYIPFSAGTDLLTLTHSLTHSLTHLLTYLLPYSLTHLLTYSLMSRW